MPIRFILSIAIVLGAVLPVAAHNIWGVANQSIPAARLSQKDVEAAIDAAERAGNAGARFVYERATLWTPGQTLHLCYFGGSESQRNRVEAVTQELFKQSKVNLKFVATGDCKPDTAGLYSSEMRVSLANGCCAAIVGRAAMLPDARKGPSIFIEGDPEKETVKHELIHALGFHHEHQKPTSPCKFNYAVIQAAYGWEENSVKTNFDRLNENSSKYVHDPYFDDQSIMKYYFDPKFLVDGKESECFSPQATDLSGKDIAGLQRAYPVIFDAAKDSVANADRATMATTNSATLNDLLLLPR